jgi:hypothetical protein
MKDQKSVTHQMAQGGGRLLVHLVALVVGLILMIVGVALGVTLVMLPLGIPMGFVGLFVFLWGIFGRAGGGETTTGVRDRS